MKKDLAHNYSIIKWIKSVRDEPIQERTDKKNHPVKAKADRLLNISILIAIPAFKALIHFGDSINDENLDLIEVFSYFLIMTSLLLTSLFFLKKSMRLKRESKG
jgi:hypothetical protein